MGIEENNNSTVDELKQEREYKIQKLEKYSDRWRDSKRKILLTSGLGLLSIGALALGIGSIGELVKIPEEYKTQFLSFSAVSLTSISVPSLILALRGLGNAIAKKIDNENKIDKTNSEIRSIDRQLRR